VAQADREPLITLQHAPDEQKLSRITVYVLGALVLLAPLPFGSVQGPWWQLVCGVAIGLSLLWLLRAVQLRDSTAVFPPTPFEIPTATFVPFFIIPAIHLLQLIPLPRFFLRLIAPGTEGFLYAVGVQSKFAPITLVPDETVRALLLSTACAAVLVMAAKGVAKRNQLMALFVVFILGGVFQSIYGMSERFSGHNYVLWYPKVAYLESATGTFISRNHFAAVLEMALGASFGMIVYRIIRSRDSKTHRSWGLQERVIVHAVGGLLILGGLMASLSRAGIAVALLSLICVGVGLGVVHSRRSTIMAVAVLLIGTLGFAFWIGAQPLAERIDQLPEEMTEETGRFAVWKNTSAAYQEFLLLGSGGGTYEQVFYRFRSNNIPWRYDHAHNEFLEDRVETGILGVLARIAGLFAAFVTIGRLMSMRRSRLARALAIGGLVGCSAVVLHALFDFPWRNPAVALQFHILLGLTLAAASRRIETEKIRVKRRRHRSSSSRGSR